MLDTRIDNAVIHTGDPPGAAGPDRPLIEPGTAAPVGIRGGRIVLDIAPDAPARAVIDAAGRVLCPGFIDIHSHSDYAALYAPTAVSKALAGYTTELNGNCGYGAFPLIGPMKQVRQEEYAPDGLTVDWETTEEYFDRCRENPMALNQGLLIAHGTLRGSVVGLDDRPADRDQRRTMQRQVEHAMQLGCFGMSTGLVYAPGSFADRDEVVALAEVVADHGGLYASHLRSESDTLVEALDEFLSVCEQTRCRAQYSHVKTAGQRNWHKLAEVRSRIDAARAAGVEVFADRYPYTASCTDLATILLPNDTLGGGPDAIIQRLQNKADRAEIRQRIEQRQRIATDGPGWYDRVMVSGVHEPTLRTAEGKTLAQLAEHLGEPHPLEAAFDLLIADRAHTAAIHFSMSEDNLREILRWDDVMIGSDACLRDTVGEACADHPHPRAYGTPARLLGQYCRDAGLLDLTTAIHKLTGLCARVMRLRDRGLIRDGYHADLVLFDPETIADRATFQRPAQPPAGIERVFINGQPVVTPNGDYAAQPTHATPGQLLTFHA